MLLSIFWMIVEMMDKLIDKVSMVIYCSFKSTNCSIPKIDSLPPILTGRLDHGRSPEMRQKEASFKKTSVSAAVYVGRTMAFLAPFDTREGRSLCAYSSFLTSEKAQK